MTTQQIVSKNILYERNHYLTKTVKFVLEDHSNQVLIEINKDIEI